MVTTKASVHELVMQLYNTEVRRIKKWRHIILLSKHLHCQVTGPNSTALDRLSDVTDRRTLRCFRAAFMTSFTLQPAVCKAKSAVSRDICQDLSSTPSCPSRRSFQANNIYGVLPTTLWYLIWTNRHICRNQIEIAFQATLPCGLDLICKNCISCDFWKFTFNKVNLNTIWIRQKSDLGWQSEQGLSNS